jgi:hypothetical protein
MKTASKKHRAKRASKRMNIGLWIVQSLLSLTLVGAGIWKLAAGQVSPSFLYAIGAFDILGGLGVLLPSVTRIKPRLTVLAALACVAVHVSAIVFHVLRGEAANTSFNFVLVALALFVAWGRRSPAPIPSRAG